jgi:hypothetical protein
VRETGDLDGENTTDQNHVLLSGVVTVLNELYFEGKKICVRSARNVVTDRNFFCTVNSYSGKESASS